MIDKITISVGIYTSISTNVCFSPLFSFFHFSFSFLINLNIFFYFCINNEIWRGCPLRFRVIELRLIIL